MNINLTSEQNTEFKELLADLTKEARILPQTYKYKFDTPSTEIKNINFYHQENLKLKKESSYRPVSATKSPAPSVSLPVNNNTIQCLNQEKTNVCLNSSPNTCGSVPSSENHKTRTVLKYKRQP